MTDKDNDGWTVMLAAAHGGSVDAIEFMLANGGSVIEERSDGRTLMMFAAQGGSVEVMKYIPRQRRQLEWRLESLQY